jgi:hypothetical protein
MPTIQSVFSPKRKALLVFSREDTVFIKYMKQNLACHMDEPITTLKVHFTLMQSTNEHLSLVNKSVSERNAHYR